MEEHREPLKRERDSLDDFEHLGHDSSPLQEIKQGAENVAAKVTDEFSTSKPVENLLDQPLVPEKMDSNLLSMGDHFPDRKEADDKLDKFLQEMSAPFANPPEKNPAEEKYNMDNLKCFIEGEKELLQFNPEKPKKDVKEDVSEKLEQFSDSDDDFKPSKYEDISKKHELPESFSFGSTESIKKVEDFKDVKEESPKKQPVEAPKKEVVEEKIVKELPEKKEEKKQEVPKKIEEVTEKTEVKKGEKKIEAEALFCKMGLDTWFNPEKLNPNVESLIYWRDPKKSGPVFGGVLLVLLALTYFSLISVVAYLSLITLTGTIAFRIYKNIVQAIQKTGDGHPFKELLELDVSLPQDKVKELVEVAVAHVNAAIVELRRLFLVEDLVDSIKFAVLLWTLTYLGSWFNGMTLIIIAWVALFTLPKVYEANKTQIDANLETVRTKLAEITSKVKAAIPLGKKPEEKKEQ